MKFYQKYKTIIFFISVFIVLFLMSYYCHYNADDYNYAHIPWTTIKLTGIRSIIQSQVIMYQHWSGRILFSALGQFFMMMPKWFYAFLNSIIFISLLIWMNRFFKKRNNQKLIIFIITFFLIWTFTPDFVEDFIWISGSVNYLWPVLITIIFMSLFYRKYYLNQSINSVMLLTLSFITGFSHEITIFVSLSYLFFFIIFNFQNIIKLIKQKDKIFIGTLLIYTISIILCIFAPGNFERAQNSITFNYMPVLQNFWAIKGLLILLVVILFYQFFNNRKKCFIYTKYIFLPILLSLIPMLFISGFIKRVMLIYVVLIIIVIIDGIYDFLEAYPKWDNLLVEMIMLIITFMVPFYVASYYSTTMKKYNEDILFATKEAKLSGKNTVLVDQLKIPNQIILKYTLNAGHRASVFPNSIYSHYFCNYYGCNYIVAKKENHIIVTVISNSTIQIKYNNTYFQKEKEYLLSDNSKNNNTYIFQIPREYQDTFEIITTKNNIQSIEITDFGIKKKYLKDDFPRIIVSK